MEYIQQVTPNVEVWGYSGGCLQYVDDGVNPPNRQATAQISWDYAVKTGVAHPNEQPPNGVWVPVYYSIDNGQWAGYGHVAWYYSDGKTTKIYDSEYGAGIRTAPYTSHQDLFNYMGWQMRYYGWSEAVDGLTIVKPKPQEPNKPQEKKGKEKMTVLTTEAASYILTNDGYMTFIPKDEITVAFKKIYPTVSMKDVDARNMFLLLKNKK